MGRTMMRKGTIDLPHLQLAMMAWLSFFGPKAKDFLVFI